jgi:ribonuclease HII
VSTIGRILGELVRIELLRELEMTLERAGYAAIAGVDEAGRGALAGPVVAAAVVPGDGPPILGVDDSKQLAPPDRARLAEKIRAGARAWAVGVVPAATIDAGNILRATRLAMLQALGRLAVRPDLLITDYVPLGAATRLPCLATVKGDALSYAVACASIVAKVERDRLLVGLDGDYPHYGFARHKGYGAPEHLAALERYGPCREHRLTYFPVLPRMLPRTFEAAAA